MDYMDRLIEFADKFLWPVSMVILFFAPVLTLTCVLYFVYLNWP